MLVEISVTLCIYTNNLKQRYKQFNTYNRGRQKKRPVRIREKNLKDGNKSLYLDIYMRGTRKKEGLKLYLVLEVSVAAKIKNQISIGVGISTVGKILEHKSTVSTHVYAKVSLESKIDVVNLTNGVF